jgi:flagellar hook assembly protein FlgD
MTLIPYTIAQEHRATLTIYNLLGQQVRLLVDEKQQPGRYEVVWRGVDDSGNSVGNGVYFYMLRAGNERRVRRVALVK